MNSQFFCAFHAEKMRACETEALDSWSQMMHRGMKAYVDCRIDAALIYFGSALDIALLRYSCANNGVFSDIHLIKPAEFLVQLHLTNEGFDKANAILLYLSNAVESINLWRFRIINAQPIYQFIAKQFKWVELSEKRFLGIGDSSKTKSNKSKQTAQHPLLQMGMVACH